MNLRKFFVIALKDLRLILRDPTGLVFMLLMIAQFIAFFNYTNIPRVLAVQLAGVLESAGLGALPLLIGFGISEVSMGLSAVAQSKKIIRALSRSKTEELAAKACALGTAAEVENYLRSELAEYL